MLRKKSAPSHNFLGHIVGKGTLHIDLVKFKVILEQEPPTKVMERAPWPIPLVSNTIPKDQKGAPKSR